MPIAPDVVKRRAIYGSGAFSGSPTGNYNSWLSSSSTRTYVINRMLQKGYNKMLLGNSNTASNNGGFSGTTYSPTWIPKITQFIQDCNSVGITVGQVIGISTTNPPAQRVKNFNLLNSSVQLDEGMYESEYWNAETINIAAVIAGTALSLAGTPPKPLYAGDVITVGAVSVTIVSGSGTSYVVTPSSTASATFYKNRYFGRWKNDAAGAHTILASTGTEGSAYLANWKAGELAAITSMVDMYWLTQYSNKPEYNRSSFGQSVHSALVELAATLPSTPIKAGALISFESFEKNATGGNDNGSNFLGHYASGKSPSTGLQVQSTTAKNIEQIAAVFTHDGLPTTPTPREYNSAPVSVTNYISWQGVQAFSWEFLDQISTLDRRTDNVVYVVGDGADNSATQLPIARNVASRIPINAGRFLYLGDVYDTGTAAEYQQWYDKAYGSQSLNFHNLSIITSATVGNHEYGNRTVGYDVYWGGTMTGAGGILPDWDGDRTKLNPRYYSFYVGDWKFICLNSMNDGFATGGITLGSTMYNWLVAELSDPGFKKIVYCHHPRWSSGAGHPDNPNMQPLWNAMQGKALVLLSGHEHNYQAMKMRASSGALIAGGGVHQVVVGTGGKPTNGFQSSYLVGGVDPILYRTTQYGVARLTLNADSVDICFIDQFGTVLNCQNLSMNIPNVAPTVNAGVDQSITLPATATMAATVTDDGLLASPTYSWTLVSGSGAAVFSDPTVLNPVVTFSMAGTYILQLAASDGQYTSTDTITVNVVAAAASKTYTINSQNPANAAITVSVADLNFLQNGTAPFTRTYLITTNVTLTAPATSGGNNFVRWLRDGVNYATTAAITITDTSSHTFTAVYTNTPTRVYWPVYITSSNPGSGVFITVTGFSSGNTPLSNYVLDGATITLVAPATMGGRAFQKWVKDGNTLVSSSRTISPTIVAASSYTAVYVPATNEITLALYAQNSLDYFSFLILSAYTNGTAAFSGTRSINAMTYTWSFSGFALGDLSWTVEWDRIYTVTVVDSAGKTASAQINLIRPAMPSARLEVVQPTTCLSTGSARMEFNGNAPYDIPPLGGGVQGSPTFLWNDANTSQSRTGLGAGAWNVKVTDADLQKVVESAVLTNMVADGNLASNPGWTMSSASYNSTTKSIDVLAGGSFTIPVTTVSGKYYYGGVWVRQISGTSLNFVVAATTFSTGTVGIMDFWPIAFIAAGATTNIVATSIGAFIGSVYEVVIYEYDITFDTTLTVPSAMGASSVITNVICNGGSNGAIALTVTGGTPGFHYAWSKSGSSEIFPDAATISNLYAGVYSCIVSDGCTTASFGTFTVTEPSAIVTTPTVTNATQNGVNNGLVSFSSSGGTATYVYYLDGIQLPSNTATGLSAGTHTYQTIDANGCSVSGTFAVTQPASPLSLLVTLTQPLCSGGTGSALVTGSGGTSPYTYKYDSGSFAATNPNTSLAAGIHTVTIKDANDLTASTTFTIVSPAAITYTSTSYNTSGAGIADGHFTLVVKGGTLPINLAWTDGFTQTVITTGTILARTGLLAGLHSATATDANGCTSAISVGIANPITNPNQVQDTGYITDFLKRINCCLADKTWAYFKRLGEGHSIDYDCGYQLLAAIRMLKILRTWYPLGTDISIGKRGYYVFGIHNYPDNSNADLHFAMQGYNTVDYTVPASTIFTPPGDISQDLVFALQGAGWDAEYESATDTIWVYSPPNSFYNSLRVSIGRTKTNPMAGGSHIDIDYLSRTFNGAADPCSSNDFLSSQCLTQSQVNDMIEALKAYCGTCISCKCTELVIDTGSR